MLAGVATDLVGSLQVPSLRRDPPSAIILKLSWLETFEEAPKSVLGDGGSLSCSYGRLEQSRNSELLVVLHSQTGQKYGQLACEYMAAISEMQQV